MDAVKLYKKYSQEELLKRIDAIKADPKNQLTDQFYLYTPAARNKIKAHDWAIYYHMQDKRREEAERHAEYPMIEGEGAPQYTFDLGTEPVQLALL